VIGDGTIVSTGAVVFAGTRIGARVILGDQSCVRERCELGDDVVVGRGSLVENDTTDRRADEDPGRGLHHGVLDARGQRLHRALRRHDERQLHGPHRAPARADQGPDDPRGARVGGGAILCPASRSARRRSWAPARSSCRTCRRASSSSATPRSVLRDVADDELLENQG
jgi:carbonic anhydrase/acetyltransferase-like protein (isoleucine patch superfamily)